MINEKTTMKKMGIATAFVAGAIASLINSLAAMSN